MFYSFFHSRPWITLHFSIWCTAWMLVPMHLPLVVLANPDGGTVAGGSASIVNGPGQVTVRQTSDRAIVNWNGFSVQKGETTTFVQPSSKSAILNRVTGGSASRIDGSVNANGQVYLVNKNGVVVGKTGRVNTAGFTASTHDVSNSEFMSGGNLNFSGTSSASVINNGKIRAVEGDVTLIARQVENNGRITAKRGTVNLAGGTEVLVKPSGAEASGQRVFIKSTSGSGSVVNNGSIRATAAELRAAGGNEYALAVNNTGVIRATGVDKSGGRIVLKAERQREQRDVASGMGSTVASGNVQNSGRLIASAGSKAAPGKRGGSVVVTGETVRLTSTSRIDASSTGAGGQGGVVNIGGGFQGNEATIANAKAIVVEAGSEINVDGGSDTAGKGGTAILWSDLQTYFLGNISAKGAGKEVAGSGGFVEVSSKGYLDFRGDVNAGGGTLLLDPDSLLITTNQAPTLTNMAGNPLKIITGASASIFHPASIDSLLDLNSVLLQVTNSITVESPMNLNTANYLTLQTTAANGTITFNAPLTNADTGALNLLTNTLYLNAPITLGTLASPGTLSGTASRVDVGYTPALAGTIQNAVDAVAEGGTINVASGTFVENVRIFKGLTINGATSGTGTIVDANNAGVTIGGLFYGSVFYISPQTADNNVTLNHLTVTRGVGIGSSRNGGGIWTNSGNLKILNSTIANNSADASIGFGAGIYIAGTSNVLIQNSTIANNSISITTNRGGGIYVFSGTAEIDSSTIAYNDGGIRTASDNTTTVKNSIIAFNTSSPTHRDVSVFLSATFTDGGNNLIRIVDGSNFTAGGLYGTAASPKDPGIGTLGNYGGPTQTIPLLINSPALNAGGSMPGTDQRGFSGVGARNDIGAFEARTAVSGIYIVTTTGDYAPGSAPIAGSFRQATELYEAPSQVNFNIPNAQATAGIWTISAAAGTTGFSIDRNLTIDGTTQPGYGAVNGPVIRIDGASRGTTLYIEKGHDLVLKGLGITGGSNSSGGGIWFEEGTLSIMDSEIFDNTAITGAGGGIYAFNANLVLNRVTMYGNVSDKYGGAVEMGATTLASNNTFTATNSTFFNNQSQYGGALDFALVTADLNSVTITGNKTVGDNKGAGINIYVATVNANNSIIAGNTGSSDVDGDTVTDKGFNLISTPGNLIDPLLSTLGYYGGTTKTMALLPGSPALDMGDTSLLSTDTDQRGTGFSRVVNGRADIGAFESRGFTYSVVSGSGQSAMLTQAFAPLVVRVTALDPGLANLTGGKVTMVVPTDVGVASATYLPGGLTRTLAQTGGNYEASFSLSANLFRGGPYAVTVGTASFQLTNTAVALTITPLPGQGRVYGGTDTLPYGYGYSASGGVDLAAVLAAYPLTGALSRASGDDVGAYLLSLNTLSNASGANPNYVITQGAGNVYYTITGIPITVTPNAGQGKIYGTADSPLTHTVTSGSLLPGDALTGDLTRAPGENAGIYLISQGTLNNPNYIITFDSSVFYTIAGRPITVTPLSGQGKTYGGADAPLLYTITSGSLVPGDALTGSLVRIAGEDAGIYIINQGSLAAPGNYLLTYTPGFYTILPRQLLVTPESGQGKTYLEPDPVLRYFLSGGDLVAGDTLAGALSRTPGEDPGRYMILPGSLTGGRNYLLSFESGLFTILAPPPEVPIVPIMMPTMDTAAFNATRGRNNEADSYYLHLPSQPHPGFTIRYEGGAPTSAGELLHLNSYNTVPQP